MPLLQTIRFLFYVDVNVDDGFFVKIKWSYSVNGSKIVLNNNSFGNNGGDGGE